tara:strand:+ start:314 stop:649 length:336 start_codon:yes stop_codon:yes gene_type:complete
LPKELREDGARRGGDEGDADADPGREPLRALSRPRAAGGGRCGPAPCLLQRLPEKVCEAPLGGVSGAEAAAGSCAEDSRVLMLPGPTGDPTMATPTSLVVLWPWKGSPCKT